MGRVKTVALWFALVVLALVALTLSQGSPVDRAASMAGPSAPYGLSAHPMTPVQASAAIQQGQVAAVAYDGTGGLLILNREGQWDHVVGDEDEIGALSELLLRLEIPITSAGQLGLMDTGGAPEMAGMVTEVATGCLAASAPLLLLVGLIIFLVVYLRRRQKNAGANILQLRKSPARRLEAPSHLKFSDVGGMEPVKERLQDVIDLLKSPQAWADAGVRPPRGVLLEGPPGCGKTLLARAVAGEAGVPVMVMSATDLVEMFVGVGAARIRDTFENARKMAPAILFIDEIDAIGRRRGSGSLGMSHGEWEQTLNQLLVSLDGAERAQGKAGLLVVIAATNRADILDPALMRPGRFDLRLTIPPPDLAGRRAVLAVHTRKLRLDETVDLDALAAQAEGASGAELELTCNEAAVQAARRGIRGTGNPAVSQVDLQAALRSARRVVEGFNAVDALLVESASQLARPRGETPVRIHLEGGEVVEGRLLWADPTWLKIVVDGAERLVPKHRVMGVEALEGAAPADPSALRPPPDPVSVA